MKRIYHRLLLIFIPVIFACRTLVGEPTGLTQISTQASTPSKDISPSTEWLTFLSVESDFISDIAGDNFGNVYVASVDVIGAAPGGDDDTRYLYLSKITSAGIVEWGILITDTLDSGPSPIAVDRDGNVYLSGSSKDSWGTPIRPFGSRTLNGYYGRTFVAKVNGQGDLVWNTFLEGTYPSNNIVADPSSGMIYLLNDYGGGPEADELALVKLNGAGEIQQATALPGIFDVQTHGLDPQELKVDSQSNIYIGGHEDDNGTIGNLAYFVAKTNGNGDVSWKTVLDDAHWGYAQHVLLELGNDGAAYVIGESNRSWGNPINPHDGGRPDLEFPDIDYLNGYAYFVTKLDNNGQVVWNTFLSQYAIVEDSALDKNGALYLAGYSQSTWGTPHADFSGGVDGFVMLLDANGFVLWNTFIGEQGADQIFNICIGGNQRIYVGGYSHTPSGDGQEGQNVGRLFVSSIMVDD